MRALAMILLLYLATAASAEQADTSKPAASRPDAGVTTPADEIETKPDPAKMRVDNASFAVYWQQFRQAVVTNNATAVAELAYFPFILHAKAEGGPIRKLTRGNFEREFTAMLALRPATRDEAVTMMDLIEQTQAVTDSETDKFRRVGDFVFEFIDGSWRFAQSYYVP